MMNGHISLDGSSNRNPPERFLHPLYSRDSAQNGQDYQYENTIKMEVTEEAEELYVRGNDPCKEEVLPEISTERHPSQIKDPRNTIVTKADVTVKKEEQKGKKRRVKIKEEEIPPEISRGTNDTIVTHRQIKVEEEEEIRCVNIEEDEVPPEISTAQDRPLPNCDYGRIDVEKLISRVHDYPELYDHRHAAYKDNYKKDHAWRMVSKEINPDFDKLPSRYQRDYLKLLQKKWRNVKDCYTKELRKRRKEERCGAGLSNRKIYVHYSKLDYLRPVVELRRTGTNFEVSSGDLTTDEEEAPPLYQATEHASSDAAVESPSSHAAFQEPAPSTSQPSRPSTAQPSGRLTSKRPGPLMTPQHQVRHASASRRKKTTSTNLQDQNALIISSMNTFMQQMQQERSPNVHFALSLVPFIDRIRPEWRGQVMRDMTSMLEAYTKEFPPRPYVAIPAYSPQSGAPHGLQIPAPPQ